MCTTCQHQPRCPSATSSDGAAAAVVIAHPEQGWSLLCNGVVTFEDTGELLPDGRVVPAVGRPIGDRRLTVLPFIAKEYI
jgi:hypothetical protein